MKLGRKEKAGPDIKGNEQNGSSSEPDADGHGLAVAVAVDEPESRPRHVRSEPFGSLLVRRGLVSEADVAQALVVQAESGKRIGETLVAMGALNPRELTLFLADLLHMPVVDLRRHNPQPDALELIPEDIVRQHMAVPVTLDDDGLQVAVPDQPSVGVRALLTQSIDKPIRFVLAPESDIQWAIDSSYRAIGGVDRLVEAFEALEGTRKKGGPPRPPRPRSSPTTHPWSRSSPGS